MIIPVVSIFVSVPNPELIITVTPAPVPTEVTDEPTKFIEVTALAFPTVIPSSRIVIPLIPLVPAPIPLIAYPTTSTISPSRRDVFNTTVKPSFAVNSEPVSLTPFTKTSINPIL